MFEPPIRVEELDRANRYFSQMNAALDAVADFHRCSRTGQVTPQSSFPALYAATRDFYLHVLPDVFSSCVPLYHSVWKHTLHSANGPDNLHQDAGVQYFANKGYDSRMLNVWICLHKSVPESMPDDELGLYVVETRFPENRAVYEELLGQNVHVSSKSATILVDNMQVGGPQIRFHRDKLRLTTFPYRIGTMVTFSSHLLHGSKKYDGPLPAAAPSGLEHCRVALSSVWLHREDLNQSVLELPVDEYETLYLRRHERSMWPELKQYFGDHCRDENLRLANIKALIGIHSRAAVSLPTS